MAESDRLLSDCTPLKGVPRVRIPLSPPFFPLRASIPLVDAIVAAFAVRHNAALIHKNPESEVLAGILPMEALPCKSK